MVQARVRGKVPPALQYLTAIAALELLNPVAAAGNNGSHLSHGQFVGVVVGSVAGGVLLVLVACLCCCFYVSSRRRQTGDLTWAKAADLEEVAYTQQPGEPGPSSDSDSSMAMDSAGGASNGGIAKPVLPVAVAAGDGLTPLETAAAAAALQGSNGASVNGHTPRSRGGMVHFLLPRRNFTAPRRASSAKEKHLEVSQSTRVEPSAEVELSTPFDPSATNHGPPLSKSSMLLRWLHGAEDDHADSVAAQLVAAAAAVAGSAASPGSPGKASSAHGKRGSPAARFSPFSDRLPLLSLAAQQTGIVWSKMPPSVASSPAVSVTEGSMSRHMLKGSWRRSDAPEDRLTPGGVQYSGSFARAHQDSGDDRYPPSLSFARVESLSGAPHQRPGIVFDHLPVTTPSISISRASTLSNGACRPPTFGGAVLPMPPSAASTSEVCATGPAAEAAVALRSVSDVELSFRPNPTPAAAAPAGPGLPQQQSRSKGGWDSVVDASAFAQAIQDVQQHGGDQAQPSPWLHQVLPQQLTVLQEEDEEQTAEVAPEPLQRPLSKSLSNQLAPSALPLLAGLLPNGARAGNAMSSPELPYTPNAPRLNPAKLRLPEAGVVSSGKLPAASLAAAVAPGEIAGVTWVQFTNDGDSRPVKAHADAAPLQLSPVASRTASDAAGVPAPVHAPISAVRSPFDQHQLPGELPVPAEATPGGLQAPTPPNPAVPGAANEVDGVYVVSIGGGVVPGLSPQVSGGGASSPASQAGSVSSPTGPRVLALRRRAAAPPPVVRAPSSRSGGGARSPASVSPSMGMHFPDLPDAWEERPAVKVASEEAAMERQHALPRSKSGGGARVASSGGAAELRRNASGGGGSPVRGKGSRGGALGRSRSMVRPESPVAGEWSAVPPSPSSSQGNR